MTAVLKAWVVATILMLAPYRPPEEGSITWRRFKPDASKEAHRARIESISSDLVDVVEAAPPLPGMTRANTIRLMLSIAFFESGFQRDVDLGLGKHGRGDFGKSFCLMQIQTGKGKVPIHDEEIGAWTGQDLVDDRKKCFRAGLELLRRSMGACRGVKDDDGENLRGASLISAYTTGKCTKNESAAVIRWSFAWGKTIGRAIPKPEPKEAPGDAAKSAP